MIEKTLIYLNAFSSKRIDILNDMFSDDIVLYDWETKYIGKHLVLQANKNIFESFSMIQVNPINIINNNKKLVVAAQIEIIFNNEKQKPLYVVDIITYNDNHKIKSIIAYNRNFNKNS